MTFVRALDGAASTLPRGVTEKVVKGKSFQEAPLEGPVNLSECPASQLVDQYYLDQ